MILTILAKLTLSLQDSWRRTTLQLRRRYSKELQQIDLTNINEDEMTLVNDLLYSSDASQYQTQGDPTMQKTQKKIVQCTIKDMILKITSVICNKLEKQEENLSLRRSFAMDV